MTTKQIDAAQAQEAIKYTTARAIRELLDKARAEYGAERWDRDDVETAVLEFVTGEADE